MLTAFLLISMGHALASVSSPSLVSQEPSWNSSLQLGVGNGGGSSIGLLLPRLGLQSEFGQLQLSFPIWHSLGDNGPRIVRAKNWGSAFTYVSLIESFLLRGAGGNVQLRLGTLHQESLGSGVLVDGYSGSWDPLSFQTGAVAEIKAGGLSMTTLVNRLDQPNFMAIGAQIFPLWWVGDPDKKRFVLTSEVALDKSPPTMPEKDTLVSGDFGARLVFLAGQFFQVEGILSGVLIDGSRFGAHIALLVEWLENAPLPGDSVALQIDLIRGWADYRPSYFGPLYDVERFRDSKEYATPNYAQVKLTSKAGAIRYGLKTLLNLEGRVDIDLYAKVMQPRWSFMALFHQSGIGSLKEVGQANSSRWAEAELAVTVYEQFYSYTQWVLGWHFFEEASPTPLALWTLGIGMHFGGKLPPS